MTLLPGQGYWVQVEHASVIPVPGTPETTPVTLTYQAGWQLLGNPFDASLPIANITNHGLVNTCYSYNPRSGWEVIDLTMGLLNPGRGCWINLSAPTTLTYPAEPGAVSGTLADDFADGPDNWNLWGRPAPSIDADVGLPAPSFAPNGDWDNNSGGISNAAFNIQHGLSVAADLKAGPGSCFHNARLGLSTGETAGYECEPLSLTYMDIGGLAENVLSCTLGNESHQTTVTPGWHRCEMVIRKADLRVEYYVDGGLVYTSLDSLSPYSSLFVTILGREGARVDNVLVSVYPP